MVDASVAIKWVVREPDSGLAMALLADCRLAAPDLLVPECANILWKKARRGELAMGHALAAAQLLAGVDIELRPTRHLLESATRLAIDLDHPAYDCVYLALAVELGAPFVTADARLRRRVDQHGDPNVTGTLLSLRDAVDTHRSTRELNDAP